MPSFERIEIMFREKIKLDEIRFKPMPEPNPLPKAGNTVARSFQSAFKGLLMTFKSERNARLHGLLAIAVIAAGIAFGISFHEWCIVILCIVIVIAAEAFNTAIERLCDLVDPNYNQVIGRIKDMAAGAVLILSIGALIVGALVFLPKLFNT